MLLNISFAVSAVRAFLASKFGLSTDDITVSSLALMRGYLFYPLLPTSTPPHPTFRTQPSEIHAAPSLLAHRVISEAFASPPTSICGAVSSHHLVGWWTRDIRAAFDRFAGSLWALPGNGAAVKAGAASLGAQGGKLHWMAPAVASRVGGVLQVASCSRMKLCNGRAQL